MQILFHTVDPVYLRKESQMLTNALRNHSQSPLDGSANMFTPHGQQQNGTTWKPGQLFGLSWTEKMADFSLFISDTVKHGL